jgi:hypothetical protein
MFLYLDETTAAIFYGTLEVPKLKFTLQQAKECLRKIPDADIYPLVPSGFPLSPAIHIDDHTYERDQRFGYTANSLAHISLQWEI